MTIVFPVIFTQTNDEKDTYLVEIPDIQGMTEGYGLADAIHMARDYIGCHCYDMNDSDIPKASRLNEIDVSKSEFAGAGESVVSFVDLDLDTYRRKMDNRAIRKNVSIPSWMNKAADEQHINVSRVLQEALMERLR